MQTDKPFQEVQTCENVSLKSPCLGQQCLRRPGNTEQKHDPQTTARRKIELVVVTVNLPSADIV